MTAHLKLPAAAVLDSFKGLVLPDLAANRGYLGGASPGLAAASRAVAAILVQAGLIEREATFSGLVSAAFLPDEDAR